MAAPARTVAGTGPVGTTSIGEKPKGEGKRSRPEGEHGGIPGRPWGRRERGGRLFVGGNGGKRKEKIGNGPGGDGASQVV